MKYLYTKGKRVLFFGKSEGDNSFETIGLVKIKWFDKEFFHKIHGFGWLSHFFSCVQGEVPYSPFLLQLINTDSIYIFGICVELIYVHQEGIGCD